MHPPKKQKREERGRKCGFGGSGFFKDKECPHNQCAAAKGAGCHLFTRCEHCSATGGSAAMWVCLCYWENIAAKVNGYAEEKKGTRWPIQHPVLGALRTTDWRALRDQSITARKTGAPQARAALGLPLSPPFFLVFFWLTPD